MSKKPKLKDVIDKRTGPKIREVIDKRMGVRNDCVGYCLDCPQAKTTLLSGGIREILEVSYCAIPPYHTVTFPRPRGRGRYEAKKG